jgi:hypothetical protein
MGASYEFFSTITLFVIGLGFSQITSHEIRNDYLSSLKKYFFILAEKKPYKSSC